MHLGLESLSSFFDAHYRRHRLVLATVTDTAGSTYRKPGAIMLFSENGERAGLISGGCLEDDLAGHAGSVFQDGRPRRVNYDLHDDPDLVLGLGLGCGGDLAIQLQPVNAGAGLDILAAMFRALDQGRACRLLQRLSSTVAESGGGGLALLEHPGPGVGDRQLLQAWGDDPTGEQATTSRLGAPRVERRTVSLAGQQCEVLAVDITPPPQVLICGAGPDAVPMVSQVRALGWRCRVVDHRAAYAVPARFAEGTEVILQRPDALDFEQLDGITAAVVMSHHVEHDLDYLRALSASPPEWVGLLGPAKRRITLLERLGDTGLTVFGPAGLDIGAEMPGAVALSIVAAIHAHLNGRAGGVLTHG